MSGAVPELRFPGFEGDWDPKTVGEIAQISKGKGISKADIIMGGETPCIRYGELYTTYDTKIEKIVSFTDVPVSALRLSAGGEVIIPASGETPEDIATAAVVVDGGVALGGDLNVLTTASNGHFLALYFSGKKRMALAAMAQGNSVVHLYPTQISSLEIGVPSLPEQTKLAEFLGVVDAKLAALRRKKGGLETFKSGLMQQLFTQTLRFTRDDGTDFPDWEEVKLGKIINVFSGGTPTVGREAFYGGEIPFIKSGEIEAEETAQTLTTLGLSSSSAKLVEKGDLLMALYGANSGQVAISKISGAINQAVLCIRSDQSITYLFHYLGHSREVICSTYLQGGQGNLSAEIVKSLMVPVPHPDEQSKIADALSALDAKISAVGEQIAQMQTFKQGLLQQMFV